MLAVVEIYRSIFYFSLVFMNIAGSGYPNVYRGTSKHNAVQCLVYLERVL